MTIEQQQQTYLSNLRDQFHLQIDNAFDSLVMNAGGQPYVAGASSARPGGLRGANPQTRSMPVSRSSSSGRSRRRSHRATTTVAAR